MWTREPRLVLVSLLIGRKKGARTLNQSLSEVMKNQSNSLITFHTQLKTALVYSWISHDVTAAMLVSPNNAMAAMLVSRSNPPGIESYYYANVFFCFRWKTWLLITWVKPKNLRGTNSNVSFFKWGVTGLPRRETAWSREGHQQIQFGSGNRNL